MEKHDFDLAFAASWFHRELLMQDSVSGCYYCKRIFSPSEITEWTDDGNTAICPYCGVDSVIGESSGLPITTDVLEEMHRRWF